MLYDQNTKTVRGLDGEPIRPRAIKTVQRYQKESLRKLTPSEQAFCRLIAPVCAKTKIRYVKQPIMYVTAGLSFRLEFLFRKYGLAVEIDGPEHRRPEQKEQDEWRDRILLDARGIRTLRLSNDDVQERYLECRAKVVEALIASPKGYKRYLLAYRNANN